MSVCAWPQRKLTISKKKLALANACYCDLLRVIIKVVVVRKGFFFVVELVFDEPQLTLGRR